MLILRSSNWSCIRVSFFLYLPTAAESVSPAGTVPFTAGHWKFVAGGHWCREEYIFWVIFLVPWSKRGCEGKRHLSLRKSLQWLLKKPTSRLMTIPSMEAIEVDLNLHLAGWPRNSWGFDGDILGCETQLDYPKKKSLHFHEIYSISGLYKNLTIKSCCIKFIFTGNTPLVGG